MSHTFLVVLAIGAFACSGETPGAEDETETAVTGTRISRSLVVRDPEILERFGFERTMTAIRDSALSEGQTYASTESNQAIFQRWMRSFGTGETDGCDRSTIDPNGYGLVCPRRSEAKLATAKPFGTTRDVTFTAVGLFNRFDLMPSTGATCGEYRIVYAMSSQQIAGRAFIIFEAALPNPDPASGVNGCLPVARFWQELTNDDGVTSRGTKLVNFYFKGTAVPGFAPVISARNFGLRVENATILIRGRSGQIRTNFFTDSREWQLREFKLERSCPTNDSCALLFNHVPVKANPAEELFAGTHPLSADFRDFFKTQVVRLASDNPRMTFGNRFNEFESVSQSTNVVYADVANETIKSEIQAELTRIASRLTPKNILDRATTQTCAGCHRVSSGASIGGGKRFPESLGFVHIDEERNLSPALTEVFLPARLRRLEAFITAMDVPQISSAAEVDETPAN